MFLASFAINICSTILNDLLSFTDILANGCNKTQHWLQVIHKVPEQNSVQKLHCGSFTWCEYSLWLRTKTGEDLIKYQILVQTALGSRFLQEGQWIFSLFASIPLLLNFNTFRNCLTTVYLPCRIIFNRHQNICTNRKLISLKLFQQIIISVKRSSSSPKENFILILKTLKMFQLQSTKRCFQHLKIKWSFLLSIQ